MINITTERGQTLYDIAVQHYGTCEALAEMMANNPHLRNDPQALSAQGIDYLSDRGFYLDVALLPGIRLQIDVQSTLIERNTIREITRNITTYGT